MDMVLSASVMVDCIVESSQKVRFKAMVSSPTRMERWSSCDGKAVSVYATGAKG